MSQSLKGAQQDEGRLSVKEKRKHVQRQVLRKHVVRRTLTFSPFQLG